MKIEETDRLALQGAISRLQTNELAQERIRLRLEWDELNSTCNGLKAAIAGKLGLDPRKVRINIDLSSGEVTATEMP